MLFRSCKTGGIFSRRKVRKQNDDEGRYVQPFAMAVPTIAQLAHAAGGNVSTKNGATRDGDRVTFSRAADAGDPMYSISMTA